MNTAPNNLRSVAEGDPVVFQRRFAKDQAGHVHKVTEGYLYVRLTKPETGLPYVSCIKFRRRDGVAFRDRTINPAYRLVAGRQSCGK